MKNSNKISIVRSQRCLYGATIKFICVMKLLYTRSTVSPCISEIESEFDRPERHDKLF